MLGWEKKCAFIQDWFKPLFRFFEMYAFFIFIACSIALAILHAKCMPSKIKMSNTHGSSRQVSPMGVDIP
jgi:hypothetical protein